MDLVEALKSFNRKERFWLIRNALGPASETLDEAFRRRLQQAIGVEVPATAWWAMDYHLDWLVGALTMLARGDAAFASHPNDQRLVCGNQEDMDLVVAFDRTLVLIEAKGDTAWSNEQFQGKVKRLEGLQAAGLMPSPLRLFFVLTSPRPPVGLVPKEGTRWSPWMCDDQERPLFFPLEMPTEFWKVTRWDDERQQPSFAGTRWKIVPSRGSA